MREITEQHTFSKERIEGLLKSAAKSHIINGFYKGVFSKQTVIWNDDTTVTVITKHIPTN